MTMKIDQMITMRIAIFTAFTREKETDRETFTERVSLIKDPI